jgi:hypothetical protein
MSNYTKSTNFATKDALSSGNALKIVKGTEIDTEFNNIQTAIATKLDSSSGTITGATINNTVIGNVTPNTGAFTTLSASGATTLSGTTTISNAVLPVIDNIKLGYETTATAAGTTTLTSTNKNQQYFTGSTTQTVVLPVTSTLALGLGYLIVNNSTGDLTVQSSGANIITLVPPLTTAKFTCVSITGTTAASWSYVFEGSSTLPYKQIPTITASVATNILTFGLNPCSLDFRSSTASSGATTTRVVTAAISMTVSNGSTLGTTSGAQSKLAILAIDNAGTVELAVVNEHIYGFLDERSLISTTAEGGTGTADSGSVIYSTTARTSVPFRIVGYIQSTQATAGAWATSPSNVAGVGGTIVPQQFQTITSGTALSYTSATNGGTTLDFVSLPSWIKRITIVFQGLSLSASAQILVRLGTGATPSYATSGYSSTSGEVAGSSSATARTDGFNMTTNSSSQTVSGIMTIVNITGNAWVSSHTVKQNVSTVMLGGGDITLGAVLTAIRITSTSSDTFDNGSVNILYE